MRVVGCIGSFMFECYDEAVADLLWVFVVGEELVWWCVGVYVVWLVEWFECVELVDVWFVIACENGFLIWCGLVEGLWWEVVVWW